ncbi:hypothetical protein GE061_008610 [Apolygus lucorum]|uniref:Peptidase S1 domain-containing protein n=1 Tax=Apolygus lucorum TaxID=248454 RepID=A0A8S9WMY9_APOLU|nr:hypothetical protein GE061_008610 [Apolygus lucorum]
MRINCVVLVLSLALIIRQCVGEPARPEEFPFFATLLYKNRGVCGAVLYTTTRLVATCHCLVTDNSGLFRPPHSLKRAADVTVDMGNDGDRPTGMLRVASSIAVHPECECTKRSLFYDFGVIELNEPMVLQEGIIAVAPILEEHLAIRQALENPSDYWCVLLDFSIIKRKVGFDLGSLEKSDVTLETFAWCKFHYSSENKNVDYNEEVQTCSNSYESPCREPDLGGAVLCANSKDAPRKLAVAMLSGRNHPYCGKYFHFPVKEAYARMDAAVKWLQTWVPPPTTSTSSPVTDETGSIPTRKSTTHKDCGTSRASHSSHVFLWYTITFLPSYSLMF